MRPTGKTGERVMSSGMYQNKYGKKVNLSTDDVFPPCPKEGKSIDWEKVD